jgi:hypothetical protein
MPPAWVLVAAAIAGAFYYGGKAVVPIVGHAAKKTAQVISQPFRHPKKDAKVIKHAVVRMPNIH